MERRLTMLLACLLLSIGMAFAQTKVTGTVISQEDGLPIIGATVMVEGTKTGTTTNMDGQFTLSVPAGKKLQISYVGMKPQVVVAKPGMKVTLESSAHVVDEVVVTGMQKTDKRLFTGATTKIDAEGAKISGVADISRSLEGRAAGVSVRSSMALSWRTWQRLALTSSLLETPIRLSARPSQVLTQTTSRVSRSSRTVRLLRFTEQGPWRE